MAKGQRKTLIGLAEICEYLDISRPTFYEFLKEGLPAKLIRNRWYSHTQGIDDYFFKIITNGNGSKSDIDAKS